MNQIEYQKIRIKIRISKCRENLKLRIVGKKEKPM